MNNNAMRFWCATFFSILVLFILFALSLSYGTVHISWSNIYHYLAMDSDTLPEMTRIIIHDIRVPRFILAVLVGAGLAMVGTLLQTVTRNDLADPFLFGLSAGASAGAVAVMTRLGSWLGEWTLPVAAFVGGIISALAVILLFSFQKSKGVERLILCGLAISFLFSSITGYLVYAGDQRSASAILFWSMGGLGLARWDNLLFAGVGVITLLLLSFFRWRSLDAMLVDEETSHSLGVSVKQLRMMVFIVSALSTAAFVSLSGVIGFVGLIVPHLAKPFSGVSHKYLIPLTAFFGSVLLALSDLLSRILISTQELPIGLVTSAIGALFILLFVLRK